MNKLFHALLQGQGGMSSPMALHPTLGRTYPHAGQSLQPSLYSTHTHTVKLILLKLFIS